MPNVDNEFTDLQIGAPIVLLPVRLETRYRDHEDSPGAELLIRVYPDDISLNGHEPLLTEEEYGSAKRFWKMQFRGEEQEAWQRLVARHGSGRALWIRKATWPTNFGVEASEPGFPPVALRQKAWSQPVRALGLPKRWVAIAYRRDGARHAFVVLSSAESKPIRSPLAVSANPGLHADPREDPDTAWLVDFGKAESAGMALRLQLPGLVVIDRLIVFGVRTQESAAASSRELEKILNAHRYTQGAALIGQGSPTNNTMTARSAYDVETKTSSPPDNELPKDCDGRRLARALGLPDMTLGGLPGAGGNEHRAARAMNNVLWPVGVGYFLMQMASEINTEGEVKAARWDWRQINAARAHYMDWVHGRGPLAALRLDETPYCVLPVSSLAMWKSGANEFGGERLIELFVKLREQWLVAARGVVQLSPDGSHSDNDIFTVLGMQASMAEIRVRSVFGPAFLQQIITGLGSGFSTAAAYKDERKRLLKLLTDLAPELFGARAIGVVFDELSARWKWPLVAINGPAETGTLADDPAGNYIKKIRNKSLSALNTPQLIVNNTPPKAPLLSVLLNLAARREYLDLALNPESNGEPILPLSHKLNNELEETLQPDDPPSWLNPNADGQFRPEDIDGRGYTKPDLEQKLSKHAKFFRQCLGVLERLSSAELQRLMGEALDTGAHRLDAWITASVARRLDDLASGSSGVASHLGCYGWVENLKPRNASRLAEHLLAPSLPQATTAAVLRSAAISGAGGGTAANLKMSSTRVRAAREVLDAVRGGQRLGEALGIRFERRILESWPEHREELAKLRSQHGMARIVTENASEPRPEAAPLDGLALVRSKEWLLSLGGVLQKRFTSVRCELAETVDAVGDLLLAESVHQFARGNADGAGAGLDALSQGAAAPDPDVIATPATGIERTTRVGVLLASDGPNPWREASRGPARIASPGLDDWVGRLFGSPERFRCIAVLKEGEHPVEEFYVSAVQLELCPLDLVAWVRRSGRDGARDMLKRRLEWAMRRELDIPAGTMIVEVDIDIAGDGDVSVGRLLEMAVAADDLLAASRPLVPADIASTGTEVRKEIAPPTFERFERAYEALNEVFHAVEVAFGSGDIRELEGALVRLSDFGFPEALDVLGVEEMDAPFESAYMLLEKCHLRIENAFDSDLEGDPVAAFGRILGDGYPVLPVYFDDSHRAERIVGAEPQSRGAAARWFQETAMVRRPVGALRSLSVMSRAHIGTGVHLGRVEYDADDGYVAPDPDAERTSGNIVLAFDIPEYPGPAVFVEGLLVDAWTEILPSSSSSLGLAVYSDSPSAQAPNAILVAVPPRLNEAWDIKLLATVLGETLDLAEIRMVDGEQLGGLAQALPLHFVPTCAAGSSSDSASLQSGLERDSI